MAISNQQFLGNLASKAFHGKAGNIIEVSSKLEAIIGGATAKYSTLWDGGFVGIDTANYTVLIDAINNYIASLNSIIESFNTEANITGALKGEAQAAAIEYVAAIKKLLEAYVSSYKNFNYLLEDSVESMKSGDTGNATAIRTEAQEVLTQANTIHVD